MLFVGIIFLMLSAGCAGYLIAWREFEEKLKQSRHVSSIMEISEEDRKALEELLDEDPNPMSGYGW